MKNAGQQLKGKDITPAVVKTFTAITDRFLCPMDANTYNIQFLQFKIRDIDTNSTIFEIQRDQDEEPMVELTPEEQNEVRTVRYQFGPQFFDMKTIGTTLTFSVGNKPVKNFTMIENHYFRDVLIRTFEFTFPFCIPNTTNSWENIYTVPELNAQMKQDMINHPYETRSDSFYFVSNQLIMHNKAEYDYSPFE